jgi:hypothetical protein
MAKNIPVQQDDWSVDKLVALAVATLIVVGIVLYSVSP